MRFRAFAACASFDRSGVQLPGVLGLDLRLFLMRLCYCVVMLETRPATQRSSQPFRCG
jgi:hypothetical protein